MLNNPFVSNVLSEVIAGVIILALPSILAVLMIFFRTWRTWAWQNISSLLVGFLIGGVLGASVVFIVFSNPSSPQTQQTVQAPPQPAMPSIPRANHPPAQVPMQEPMSGGPPPQKKEALPSPPSPIQTRVNGVVASVVRFEKSGGLLMLQLMARNTSRQRSTVCFYPRQTTLIHEATGEGWQPKEFVGEECTFIEANTSSRVWMKFDVSNPENKTFSLSSPLFNGTLDNLMLAGSP